MQLDISSWWAILTLPEKVYWIIAIPSTVLLLIQVVMTLMGGEADDLESDFDGDLDSSDGEMEGGVGWQFITYKNVLGFFTLFGWTGLGFLQMGLGLLIAVFFSFVSGLIMMAIMATLFYYISKLYQSGTMVIENAIGQTGEVYLRIPPNREGHGKLQVEIQGTLREMDAITDDEKELPTGSIAQVLEIVNNQILLVTQVLY
ncbi:MAG: hypothetical protein KAI99_04260 [Cyclobacteriaceae bacterium]|nr:hypothetical protein [Cyclobacteriaceae bacterium]MCK5467690.1 hypothetical protein [Cyclobacteriaceae bacterium]